MKTERLKPLGRCRKLREQRCADALGRAREQYMYSREALRLAVATLEENRQGRRQRENEIYVMIRRKPAQVDYLETLRWELAAMELEIERLTLAVEETRTELEAAAADVKRAREAYLREAHALRKWDKIVERAARSETILHERLAEIEQDDANIDHITRK